MTIRVLVGAEEESHRMVEALSAEDGMEVVAECADGIEVLSQVLRLRPDVVVVTMTRQLNGRLDALEVVRQLADALMPGPVTVLLATMPGDEGDRCPGPARRLRQHRDGGDGRAGPMPAEPLTARELEVTRLVARGLTNQEIAAALSLSLNTVKSHLVNVRAKLPARNRVEIAAWAWQTDPTSPRRSASDPAG